ncbi:hypothetical protein PQZ07_00190 [bacterium]|nr:hypothetical protein [bacterium]
MKNEHLIKALIKKLEGEVAVAEANVSVYLNNPAGIGEHSDIVESIEKEVGKMAEAKDKLEVCKLILHPFENVKN